MTVGERAAAERAAGLLCELRERGEPLRGLPEECRPGDEPAAYRVQEKLLRRLAARLGPHVGYKIGCTSRAMQAYLGIDHPCAGGILASTVHQSPAALRLDEFVRPGVECELAVRLGRDLPPEGAPFDRAAVAEAVARWVPAIEIVENRYIDYTALDVETLIADNFFAAACVLGEPVEPGHAGDLARASAWLTLDSVEAGSGAGSNVLGHPLNALAWLANAQASRAGLRAGEVVLLGSVVPTVWLEGPKEVVVRVEGLGEARASFR